MSFALRDGVAVYGGFNGTETAADQRDPDAHVTVLSGDIGAGGDDSDNSYHVVDGSLRGATAVLDGFTITLGRADGGTDADDGGGGMLVCGGGNPSIARCVFTDNSAARFGGAVYHDLGAGGTFDQCVFSGNTSAGPEWPDGGGAVYNDDQCSPSFSACTFVGNTANVGGAVANLFSSSPSFTDCTFTGNTASGNQSDGGGIYNYFSCEPSLTGCVVELNDGAVGGGMYSVLDSIPRVVNTIFRRNQATGDGGGMFNHTNSHAEVTNCLFAGNTASAGGGLINLFTSNASIVNCTFAGNEAGFVGAGVYNYESDATFANTILWANAVGGTMDQSAQIYVFSGSPAIRYCTIQGGAGGLGGTNNNGDDPLFVDADGLDDVFGTEDDDARPQAGSPAIDAGNNADVPVGITSDLDGGPRILAGVVDRGAYEFVPVIRPDFDHDGDVDPDDAAFFESCAASSGPTVLQVNPLCADADLDGDGDNDQDDFGVMQRCGFESDVQPDAGCDA